MDGWLPSASNCLRPFFFLTNGEGGSALSSAAPLPPTTVNLPLKVTSLDTRDGSGKKKIAESSLGNAPTNNDTAPQPPPPSPPPLCIPPCGRCAHFCILTYSLEWIIEMEAENRSGLVSQSDMTVKAETLTVQFGTKLPQRTQKSFYGGNLELFFFFFHTFHFQMKCTINLFYFSNCAIPLSRWGSTPRSTASLNGGSEEKHCQSRVEIKAWSLRKCCNIFLFFAKGNVWGHVLGTCITNCTWW